MVPDRIRCVVFDFDGTLVQSNAIKRAGYFHAARRLGPVDDIVAAVLGDRGGDRYDLLRAVADTAQQEGRLPGAADAGSIDALTAELVNCYTRRCERAIAACEAVRGAGPALETLRRTGRHMFINSATPQDTLTRIVRARGLGRYFHGLHGRPADKLANLAAIMRRGGYRPDTTVVVGDGEDDRLAAESAACHFVGITELGDATASPGTPRFQVQPRHCLPDLDGLPALIAAL